MLQREARNLLLNCSHDTVEAKESDTTATEEKLMKINQMIMAADGDAILLSTANTQSIKLIPTSNLDGC